MTLNARMKRGDDVREAELREWMKMVNTRTLELVLLLGDVDTPEWCTRAITVEVQRRREARGK